MPALGRFAAWIVVMSAIGACFAEQSGKAPERITAFLHAIAQSADVSGEEYLKKSVDAFGGDAQLMQMGCVSTDVTISEMNGTSENQVWITWSQGGRSNLRRYPVRDGKKADIASKIPVLLKLRYLGSEGVSSDEVDLAVYTPARALWAAVNAKGYHSSYLPGLSTDATAVVAVSTPFPGIREVWTLEKATSLPLRVSILGMSGVVERTIFFESWTTNDGMKTPVQVKIIATSGSNQTYRFGPGSMDQQACKATTNGETQ